MVRKLVKLSLEGQLDWGYQVELVEIKKEDGKISRTLVEGVLGTLPPARSIYETYQVWQKQYNHLEYLAFRGLKFRDGHELPERISIAECQDQSEELKICFNAWLNDRQFYKIQKKLWSYLDVSDEIRLIVKTQDYHLWQLPWSVWDFFEEYRKAEVVFSSSEARGGEKPVESIPRKQVRILGIFGDRTGIDCDRDRENLKRLRAAGAQPNLLEEPSVQKLRNLLWDKNWDIFFFAGHSNSQVGLFVNQQESLTPNEFKNTLKTAINNGLKIVFFNSCDGLKLAYQLVSEFQIPIAIAMREPVPNQVAQQFLEYFLLEYAYKNKPLIVAVREARLRIAEEWEKTLPCIDWLPVICQNPAIKPPDWQELHRQVSLKQVALGSTVCTSLVMAMRFLGLLQPMELGAFDRLMQMRPPEQPDERLLIIEVTEEDIKTLNEFQVSDKTLLKVLQKLELYQPRAVGLDIYRDVPIGEGHVKLLNYLSKNKQIFSTCRMQEPNSKNARNQGVRPPRTVPESQLGFNDFQVDRDGRIRVQLLTQTPDPTDLCKTDRSLSFTLAFNYLKSEKPVPFEPTEEDEYIRFTNSKAKLRLLQPYSGGYQRESMGGFQTLLNYRSSQTIAPRMSLAHLLKIQQVNPKLKDRLVFIGYTAESGRDIYSTSIASKMPGVDIHAHMTSQILSAVLDNRPLLWTWPWWGDALWIFGWSLAGSLLVWAVQKPLRLVICQGILVIILPAICLVILVQGGWMPLIPSLLGLTLTVGSLIIYIVYPSFQKI